MLGQVFRRWAVPTLHLIFQNYIEASMNVGSSHRGKLNASNNVQNFLPKVTESVIVVGGFFVWLQGSLHDLEGYCV